MSGLRRGMRFSLDFGRGVYTACSSKQMPGYSGETSITRGLLSGLRHGLQAGRVGFLSFTLGGKLSAGRHSLEHVASGNSLWIANGKADPYPTGRPEHDQSLSIFPAGER